MATHSSTLAWKIPWTEEPGRLQSTGSQRVGTQLSDLTFTFTFTFPLFSARMSIVIFPVYSTPLYVAYIGLCSQILGLRGTIHKKLNPRAKPADCHLAPLTLAALCPQSKAGLACFKHSVAFCLELAKPGRGTGEGQWGPGEVATTPQINLLVGRSSSSFGQAKLVSF